MSCRVRGFSACSVRYARFAERYSWWLRSGIATPLWPVINVVWFESATQGNFDLRANVREITFRQAKDSHEHRNVQRSEVHDC